MSGKINFKVRKGKSIDRKYSYYPEGYLEVTDENMKDKVKLSPSYNDLCRMLIDFRKHELKVDFTRKRNHYTSKLVNSLSLLLEQLKKIELTEFETEKIEEIYKYGNKN